MNLGAGIKDADLGDQPEMALNLIGTSPGAVSTGMMIAFLVMILGLFGIVGLFLKNRMVVLIAAAGVGIGSILSWVLQPEVSKTLTSGATPKDVTMIGMICGIIAAGCIYGAFATRKAS